MDVVEVADAENIPVAAGEDGALPYREVLDCDCDSAVAAAADFDSDDADSAAPLEAIDETHMALGLRSNMVQQQVLKHRIGCIDYHLAVEVVVAVAVADIAVAAVVVASIVAVAVDTIASNDKTAVAAVEEYNLVDDDDAVAEFVPVVAVAAVHFAYDSGFEAPARQKPLYRQFQ